MQESPGQGAHAGPVVNAESQDVPRGRHGNLEAYKKRVKDRYTDIADALASGRFRRAMAATRALVVAQALVAVMLGFILDDLAVLRAPGFLVGVIAAVAVLGLAGLPQGAWVARRMKGKSVENQEALLGRIRTSGRVLLFIVLLTGVAFLIMVGSGVPPWA